MGGFFVIKTWVPACAGTTVLFGGLRLAPHPLPSPARAGEGELAIRRFYYWRLTRPAFKLSLTPGRDRPQAPTCCTPSNTTRTIPLTTSATPIDSDTDASACRRPMVLSITAKVDTHGK